MTPLDLSIKGAIEEFVQGAAVNPIQQAIEACEWVQLVFTDDTMAQERDPELWMPKMGEALTSLRSLQKEVEGVLPEPAFRLKWRNGMYWVDKPSIGDTDVYTAEQLRTAVAAALGRGAVPSGWKLVPVEPTPEMRKAAADAWLDCDSKLFLNKAGAAVRAAIAISKESA